MKNELHQKENVIQSTKDTLIEQFNYWKQQLVDIAPLHHFPLDNPRPEKQTLEKQIEAKPINQQYIPKELTLKISALCKQYEVTLFSFLETAFAVLLSHYSDDNDILIGTLITERKQNGTESFVNALVIRTDLSAQPTFSELLKQNHRTILDAYAHQDLPFKRLAEKITFNQNVNYHPIFQIAFTLGSAEQKNNFLVQDNDIKNEQNQLDLAVYLYDENVDEKGELSISWCYDEDLFESVTIKRLMANYETLLSNIVDAIKPRTENERINSEPEPFAHDIPFLSDAEKHILLHEWRGPQTHYQTGHGFRKLCFHELFEQQVARTPENIAVVFGDDSLSYQEINQQANQLAHYLIELGVTPDMLVALCMPRSLQGIVAILGILKAGGAYVPLDPSYPQARLQYMLEHSKAELILSETHLAEKLPANQHSNQQKIIYLNTQAVQTHLQTLPNENITERPIPLTEDNLAYAIYTSGSTGKPKGVMAKHKGWVNLALSQANLFKLDANSRILQFASPSFVAMTTEISTTFHCGATLYLITEEQQRSPELLDNLVEQYQLTHAVLPQALLPHLNVDKWQSVKNLLMGGEALPPQIATRWKSGRKLFNAYGSTETASMITVGLVTDERITIGKLTPNIVARVLDPEDRLLPIGAIGQLHIGGPQLARGYLNAPEMTEKQFIRDPFNPSYTDKRLYRTGDLVRWTADGRLEFIGRADSQIKIRGNRIELGEIEEALSQHESLSGAAVIAYGEGNEDKRLVAYVCPNVQWLEERKTTKARGAKFDAAALVSELSELLETFLKRQLPEYMVPYIYIPLERMPLTPNNKVDKRSLPAPDKNNFRQQNYVAARNELEEKLCLLWQENLKVHQVGIHDNFFELGGHSLLAAKITASIKHTLDDSFNMYQLFTYPTVAEIALIIQPQLIKDAEKSEIAISELRQTWPDKKIPMSYIQKIFLPLTQMGRLEQCFHIPIALLINGKPNYQALEKSLNTLLGRHESLRFKFYQEQDQVVMKPVNDMTLDLQIVELPFSKLQTAKLQAKDLDKAQIFSKMEQFWQEVNRKPFDIYNQPLIRAYLLSISEENTGLLFDIHHMIFDGWSVNVFLHEFLQLYAAYSQGQAPALPPIVMQYSDYVYDAQERHKKEEYQRQFKFWQQQLAKTNMKHDFLADFSRNIASCGQFKISYIDIPHSVTKAVAKYCEVNNTTPYMLFMALFHTCIFMHSGVSQTITSSPRFERDRIESHQAIGAFLNALLVETSINNEMSLHDIIQQIRQYIYNSMQNSDVHISLVIDSVGEKVRNALFNIVFNYMDIDSDENEKLFTHLGMEPVQIMPTPFESLGMTFFNRSKNTLCEFVYNQELYSQKEIDSLLRYFDRLMNAIVAGQEKESIRCFYDRGF